MPRNLFICSEIDPYHICARSHNKDQFPIPIDRVWEIMSRYLFFLHYVFGVRIHAFVLMRNHFHLIASFPLGNLSAAMQYFMRETSRLISYEAGCINQIYGNRCFRSQLTSPHHFMNVYKYVYRNPVEAGVCENVEDYAFSSLGKLLGKDHLLFPVAEDTILFDSKTPSEALCWLNTRTKSADKAAMKNALRRNVFKLALVKKKPSALEVELY